MPSKKPAKKPVKSAAKSRVASKSATSSKSAVPAESMRLVVLTAIFAAACLVFAAVTFFKYV